MTTATTLAECRRLSDEWRYLTEEDGLTDRQAIRTIAARTGLHYSNVVLMVRRGR